MFHPAYRRARSSTNPWYNSYSASYLTGSNRMVGRTYDGMGNLGDLFFYDAGGRLQQIGFPATARINLSYNGLGELARSWAHNFDISTWEPVVYPTDYQFLPDGRALTETTIGPGNVAVTRDTVWLDNLPVASFQDSRDSQGTLIESRATYLYADHLGTPRMGMNAARQITWKYQSEAFGVASITGPDVINLRLPGQLSLGMLGVHYNYYRDYDPYSGRYLESDPIGLVGGINTYGYVEQNPLSGIDPTGESTIALLFPPRPIPLPGPAAGVAGAGIGGYAIGSAIYPSIAGPLGDAIDAVCGSDPDFCYNRWQSEYGRCWQWKRTFGMRWVRACQDRARYRMQLCVANGGRPDPNEPPEWSPFRDYPR